MPTLRTLRIALCLGASAGCFSPQYGSPSFACGKGSQCPYGYECGVDGLCYELGLAPDGVSAPDASTVDAMVVPRTDGPPCDGACGPGEPDAMVGGDTCAGELDSIVDVSHSGGLYTGTTSGKSDDETPLCATSTAPDVVHRFVLPGQTHLHVSTCGSNWDTVVYVKTACDDVAGEVGCNDDDPGRCGGEIFLVQSTVEVDLGPGTYFVIVDGYSTGSGDYTLSITGTIADGAPCDPEQVTSGFLECGPGRSCTSAGSGGADVCR